MRKFLATRKPSAKVGGEGGSSSLLPDVKSGGEAAHLASPAERPIHRPPNEITLVCFQPRSLPAALERCGRAIALAQAFAIALEEAHRSTAGETLADSPACAEVSSSVQSLVDAGRDRIAEAGLNSKVLPNA
jgi:hypothetical protein